MKRRAISRREFSKMAVVAAPAMVSAVRAVVKPQPAKQVSTEGVMTLERYREDDLFILQTGYPAHGRDVSDLFPIRRPGLASMGFLFETSR